MLNTTFLNQRSSTLPVVLPISWIDRLTQLAQERSISRSTLVREALQQTLLADIKMVTTKTEEA